MSELEDLTGRILIAMPGMPDDRFAHSVIVVCAHSEEGAMGLMVNKPIAGMGFADLIEQLSIKTKGKGPGCAIRTGGPVETERGFVIHSSEYRSPISTMDVAEGIAMTATLDIIEDIADDCGPERAIVMLGYCGWGTGQLEGEIAQNGWLLGNATTDLLFEAEDSRKWALSLQAQGINASNLSAIAGTA